MPDRFGYYEGVRWLGLLAGSAWPEVPVLELLQGFFGKSVAFWRARTPVASPSLFDGCQRF
jgi:hypothetical protein